MDIRKEIEELIALYSLEPNLKDVYVEGTFDKRLLEWFFGDQDISGVCVYTIDAINVPDDLLVRHGLNGGGNRSRIIALSNELSTHLPRDRCIVCIADRDQEDYLPSGHRNVYLEFTDYTSSDLYLFQQRILRKLIALVLGGFPLSAEELMHELMVVLEEVFLIRLSNMALEWNMQWIPFVRYVHINDHFIFTIDRFIKAYLQKNDRWNQREEFEQKRSELRAHLQDDPRRSIRGHDLIELCC